MPKRCCASGGYTATKAAWHSSRPRSFPKANLNIYSYPGNSVIDTHAGRFPNGYVASGVNAPDSALTLKEAMRPEAWPAEKRNLSWGSRLKALGIGSEATLPVAVNCPVAVSTAKQAMLLWPRLGAYRNRPDAET